MIFTLLSSLQVLSVKSLQMMKCRKTKIISQKQNHQLHNPNMQTHQELQDHSIPLWPGSCNSGGDRNTMHYGIWSVLWRPSFSCTNLCDIGLLSLPRGALVVSPLFFFSFLCFIFFNWCLLMYVVQSLSCVQVFVIAWTAACQTSLSFTISWSLLKLMSIESETVAVK